MDDERAMHRHEWLGENWLGEILTETRESMWYDKKWHMDKRKAEKFLKLKPWMLVTLKSKLLVPFRGVMPCILQNRENLENCQIDPRISWRHAFRYQQCWQIRRYTSRCESQFLDVDRSGSMTKRLGDECFSLELGNKKWGKWLDETKQCVAYVYPVHFGSVCHRLLSIFLRLRPS